MEYKLISLIISLFILSFILIERRSIFKLIEHIANIETRVLGICMGITYLFVSAYICIINPSIFMSATSMISFLIGCSYIVYCRSKHFNKIYLARFIREYIDNYELRADNIKIFLPSIEARKCGSLLSAFSLENLYDNKNDNTFKIKDFKFIESECETWAKACLDEESISDFITLLKYNVTNKKIRLISKSNNNNNTYRTLFDLLDSITYTGIRTLRLAHRSQMIDFICQNFTKGEEEITEKLLNPSFSKWKNVLKRDIIIGNNLI